MIVFLVLASFADKAKKVTEGGEKLKYPCPEYQSSFLSQITFNWLTGYKSLLRKWVMTAKDQ